MLIFLNPLVICVILRIYGTTWVQHLMMEEKLFNSRPGVIKHPCVATLRQPVDASFHPLVHAQIPFANNNHGSPRSKLTQRKSASHTITPHCHAHTH